MYNIEQAATKLARTSRTVRRWIDEGLLTATKAKDLGIAVGNPEKLFLKEEDVDNLAKEPTTPHSQSIVHDMPMTSPDTISTDLQQLAQKAKLLLLLPDTVEALLHEIDTLKIKESKLPDISELLARITTLEQEREISGKYLATVAVQLAGMEKRIEQLEQLASERATMAVETPVVPEHIVIADEPLSSQNAITETPAPKKAGRPAGVKTIIEPPVAGAIPHYEFADRHGVVRRTFADHIDIGIKGEKVDAIVVDHPTRAREKLRWLTPEQQEAALAFWKKHGVATYLPDGWVPLNTFALKHSLNRNEVEQLGHQGIIHGVEHGKWITSAGEKVHVALSPEGQKNALAYFRIR